MGSCERGGVGAGLTLILFESLFLAEANEVLGVCVDLKRRSVNVDDESDGDDEIDDVDLNVNEAGGRRGGERCIRHIQYFNSCSVLPRVGGWVRREGYTPR